MRSKTQEKTAKAHYPAPHKLVDLWEEHGGDAAAMQDAEIESFAELLETETATNLRQVFRLRQNLKQAARGEHGVKRLHVVGAGEMGADIAAWALVRGLAVTLEDRATRLSIFTGLTLERPEPDDPVGSRFFGPARDRLFGRYPALRYAELLRTHDLPDNIALHEFFFLAGKWLGHPAAQQNHICANYTHALGYLLQREPNVVAQLLARDGAGRFSLSCNADVATDLLALRRRGEAAFLFAGEINSQFPFMPGSAVIERDELDLLLDDPETDFELFSAPRLPVSETDHAAGLHVSRPVPDGGTLQIGIGAMGDAVAHALRLRHQRPDQHRDLVLGCPFPAPPPEDHQGYSRRVSTASPKFWWRDCWRFWRRA